MVKICLVFHVEFQCVLKRQTPNLEHSKFSSISYQRVCTFTLISTYLILLKIRRYIAKMPIRRKTPFNKSINWNSWNISNASAAWTLSWSMHFPQLQLLQLLHFMHQVISWDFGIWWSLELISHQASLPALFKFFKL